MLRERGDENQVTSLRPTNAKLKGQKTMPAVKTPDWVKDAIFYQIFPDRFAKSSRLPKPNNLEPWDTPPTEQGYKGGDLPGVVEHLDLQLFRLQARQIICVS